MVYQSAVRDRHLLITSGQLHIEGPFYDAYERASACSLLGRQFDQFAAPGVVADGEAGCFGEREGTYLADLFTVCGVRRRAHNFDVGPSPQPGLCGVRQVGAVRARPSISDSDMSAQPMEGPGQPGAGLFAEFAGQGVVNGLAGFPGPAGEEPHIAALVAAQQDLVVDEPDHMCAGNQLVWRKLSGEGHRDRCPLPAVGAVKQRVASH